MHTIAGALDQAIVLIWGPTGKRALRTRLLMYAPNHAGSVASAAMKARNSSEPPPRKASAHWLLPRPMEPIQVPVSNRAPHARLVRQFSLICAERQSHIPVMVAGFP